MVVLADVHAVGADGQRVDLMFVAATAGYVETGDAIFICVLDQFLVNAETDPIAIRATDYELYDSVVDRIVCRISHRHAEVTCGAITETIRTKIQALDHVEVKCELVALYEEMEDKDLDRAMLKTAIARSLRARKDVEALQEAFGLLKEVEIRFPELVAEDVKALEKLLALSNAAPADPESATGAAGAAAERLGRRPVVLVVGGNDRALVGRCSVDFQRGLHGHHPADRLDEVARSPELALQAR